MLALALDTFGLGPDVVWRVASTLAALLWVALHTAASRRFRTTGSQVTKTRFLLLGASLAIIGIGLLVWNAIIPDEYSGARYIAALMLALTVSAFYFLLETFANGSDQDFD